MENRKEETIAAISTPVGEGGIGVVRMSGPAAEKIAKRIFTAKRGRPELVSHRLYYGEIFDPENDRVLDEALVVLMRAPRTYTREDIFEIQCHGGYVVLRSILELVLMQGARLAGPGEFTRRAFLNGRIDLTQAEAVIDLITAKSTAALSLANRDLAGGLYDEIVRVTKDLTGSLVLIEANIDFPDEEIDPVSHEGLAESLSCVVFTLKRWLATYEEGRIFREGASCVIVGKTNVGKSSLFNLLVGQDRTIVTCVPGTTRDVIEEIIGMSGCTARLMDTAGLRSGTDPIELEGIRRTRERVACRDLALLVLDGSRALDEDDFSLLHEVTDRAIIAVNKVDLPLSLSLDEVKEHSADLSMFQISCRTQQGVAALKEGIAANLRHGKRANSTGDLIISNARHKELLLRAENCLIKAIKSLEEEAALEFAAFEIRSALELLRDIVGETTSESVLDGIFDRFCIGK